MEYSHSRDDNRKPAPQELGPKYVEQFMKYFDEHPSLNITVFGLNCAEPEDMLTSFENMFKQSNPETSGEKVLIVFIGCTSIMVPKLKSKRVMHIIWLR